MTDSKTSSISTTETAAFSNGAPSSCDATLETVHCVGESTDRTATLAAGDLDADGDLDLAVGYIGRQSAVYLNDGRGNFTESIPFAAGNAPDA